MDGIHLTQYHDAVKAWLKKNITWLQIIECYPKQRNDFQTPCAFFAVRDWERADRQPMNGMFAVTLNCVILAVLGVAEDQYQIDIRNMAMEISMKVDKSRFDLPIQPAVFSTANPDAFETDLDEYAVWAIEFKQDVEVGEDFFKPSGATPDTVFTGFTPDIGTDNTDLYEQIV